jgi:Zn-dependent oligopeptidase
MTLRLGGTFSNQLCSMPLRPWTKRYTDEAALAGRPRQAQMKQTAEAKERLDGWLINLEFWLLRGDDLRRRSCPA